MALYRLAAADVDKLLTLFSLTTDRTHVFEANAGTTVKDVKAFVAAREGTYGIACARIFVSLPSCTYTTPHTY